MSRSGSTGRLPSPPMFLTGVDVLCYAGLVRGDEGPVHEISKAEVLLARRLIACAVADSPSELDVVYERAGVSQDYALRADLVTIGFGTSYLVMNSVLRRRKSHDRRRRDIETIAAELDRSELSAIIDLRTVRELLAWACRVNEDGQLPPIEMNDHTAKTYVAVAAACLVFTVPPFGNWEQRYRIFTHVLRRRYTVRESFRTPPDSSTKSSAEKD